MSIKSSRKKRSLVLIIIASIMIVIGSTMIYLAIGNIVTFGWWSLLIGIGGLTAVFASVMSIIKNDPSWILLHLIIPG